MSAMMTQAALRERTARKPTLPETSPGPSISDLERALACQVCADAGMVNRPPGPPIRQHSAPAPKVADAAVGTGLVGGSEAGQVISPPKRSKPAGLTHRQAEFVRRAWDFLADAPPGGDTDARLLAMLCVVRAARTGSLNLIGADVLGLRVSDPHAVVAALTSSGWLVTTPQSVLDADPGQSPSIIEALWR